MQKRHYGHRSEVKTAADGFGEHFHMQKRHYGHRSEMKTAADDFGEHFHMHAAQMGLNLDTQMDKIMEHCNITIIASVQLDQPWIQTRLDALEADLQDRVMTLEKHGGMNRREERRRIGS